MIALLAQAAMIFDIFIPDATYYALLIQLAVLMFYFLNPFSRFSLSIHIAAGSILAFLMFQHLLFVRMSGYGVNFNAIISYFSLISFLPFFRNATAVRTMLRYLLVIVFLYILFYIFSNGALLAGSFVHQRGVSTGDLERGARVYLALPFVAFATFYVVVNRHLNIVARAAGFALGIAALILSGSRTFQMLFALVLALRLLRLVNSVSRFAIFVGVLAISLLVLGGVLFPSWNPFAYMAWDSSGSARAGEYGFAVRAVRAHWLFGVGIAGSFGDLQGFLKTPLYEPVYPSDLGALGPMVVMGVPGLLAFVAALVICILLPVQRLVGPEFGALKLTSILCGAYGVISPSVLLETSAIFPGLLFAALVRDGGGPLAVAFFRDFMSIKARAFLPRDTWSDRFGR